VFASLNENNRMLLMVSFGELLSSIKWHIVLFHTLDELRCDRSLLWLEPERNDRMLRNGCDLG
jgi:hypothetical protein